MIKKDLKILFFIFILIFFQGCTFFSKTAKKPEEVTDSNIIKEYPPDQESTDQEHTEEEFVFTNTMTEAPCWINTAPENCDEYKINNKKFVYITSRIITEKQGEEPTDKQFESIKKKISFKYFNILNKEISKELFFKYSQCKKKRYLCETLFEEYKTQQEMIEHDFEIVDFFWNEINSQWELNVLATIPYDDFSNDKIYIITDRIISKMPNAIKIYNDPPVIYID